MSKVASEIINENNVRYDMVHLIKETNESLNNIWFNDKIISSQDRFNASLIEDAYGIAFVREEKGVSGGHGIMIFRTLHSEINKKWSPPCAVGIGGISNLFQGNEAPWVEHIIVFPNEKDIENLKKFGHVPLVSYSTSKDKDDRAELEENYPLITFSFSSEGLYKGITLEGDTLYTLEGVNNKYYNKDKVKINEIICGAIFIPHIHDKDQEYERLMNLLLYHWYSYGTKNPSSSSSSSTSTFTSKMNEFGHKLKDLVTTGLTTHHDDDDEMKGERKYKGITEKEREDLIKNVKNSKNTIIKTFEKYIKNRPSRNELINKGILKNGHLDVSLQPTAEKLEKELGTHPHAGNLHYDQPLSDTTATTQVEEEHYYSTLAPSLHGTARQLEKSQIKDTLRHELGNRPTPESVPGYDPNIAPLMAATAHKLEYEKKRDSFRKAYEEAGGIHTYAVPHVPETTENMRTQ